MPRRAPALNMNEKVFDFHISKDEPKRINKRLVLDVVLHTLTARDRQIVAHGHVEESDTYTSPPHTDNTSKADATAGASVDPKVTFDLTVYPVLNTRNHLR